MIGSTAGEGGEKQIVWQNFPISVFNKRTRVHPNTPHQHQQYASSQRQWGTPCYHSAHSGFPRTILFICLTCCLYRGRAWWFIFPKAPSFSSVYWLKILSWFRTGAWGWARVRLGFLVPGHRVSAGYLILCFLNPIMICTFATGFT